MADRIEICLPGDEGKVDSIDLLSLPFKSTYKILSWRGLANGTTVLTPSFNIIDVRGRTMVIKSFAIYNYYHAAAVDLYVTDGVTTNAETIPILGRVDRVFDLFLAGTEINLRINDAPISFFQSATQIAFPADVDLQNIYYKFPQKINTITLSILTTIFTNIQTGATQNPDVKVIMEVYLL